MDHFFNVKNAYLVPTLTKQVFQHLTCLIVSSGIKNDQKKIFDLNL